MTIGGRKGLGFASSKKKGDGGKTNRILSALILAAVLFSCTTMLLISPTISKSNGALDDIDGGSEVLINSHKYRHGHHRHQQHLAKEKEPPPAPPHPENPPSSRSTMSDLITWMLSEIDKDAGTQHATFERLADSPMSPLEFAPGSLSLSHAQTLKHCYADPKIYGKHFQGRIGDGSSVGVSYSDKHKLAYVMLPKSGSSTARYMLKNHFDAREGPKSLQQKSYKKGGPMEGFEVITFVRDPLSRFYSQYDEAYVRTAPWETSKAHPFPYIYDNIRSYHDYEDVFCPISTRKARSDCIFRKSQENGTLASRFERFVGDYDGLDPFDVHLTLQVPMLSSINGLPLHLTQIYNTTDSEGGWERIAKQFLGEDAGLGKKGVIAGRSYPRRFNSDFVSIKTQRRICHLALLDYCCLNLPLPKVCKGKHYSAAEGDDAKQELFCVVKKGGHIEPGIFPDSIFP